MTVVSVDENASGLASLLGSLIEQNLERDPSRVRLLRRAAVVVRARDADVAVTIRMEPGRVEVVDGADPSAGLTIEGDSSSLLEMTAAPLRFGLPDPFRAPGRAVVRDVLRRRIRIRGMLMHAGLLARVASLLSVE